MTLALLDAHQLASLLSGPQPPTVLDVRWQLGGPDGRTEYAVEHIPDALFVDLDTDLADPPGERGRHPLPDPERAAATMRRHGVSMTRPVVVYDAADSISAARAWWQLKYLGHPDVRVLDGGLAAWREAGQPVTAQVPDVQPGDFVARPESRPVVGADTVAALAQDGLLLDVRSGERYRGEVEPVDPVAGHIPAAVSAPTVQNVAADGRFLPAEALRARFLALGAVEDRPIAAYCGSGVAAAHTVLALEIAGLSAALYPGSWSEWVGDPSRPVATGTEPS